MQLEGEEVEKVLVSALGQEIERNLFQVDIGLPSDNTGPPGD
jgi:hypothetical protein